METIEIPMDNGETIEMVYSTSIQDYIDKIAETKYTGIGVFNFRKGEVRGMDLYFDSGIAQPKREISKRRIRNFLIWICKELGVDLNENDNG